MDQVVTIPIRILAKRMPIPAIHNVTKITAFVPVHTWRQQLPILTTLNTTATSPSRMTMIGTSTLTIFPVFATILSFSPQTPLHAILPLNLFLITCIPHQRQTSSLGTYFSRVTYPAPVKSATKVLQSSTITTLYGFRTQELTGALYSSSAAR